MSEAFLSNFRGYEKKERCLTGSEKCKIPLSFDSSIPSGRCL